MSRTRQQHTPEFKFQVVLEVLREEHTVNEIATSYQLHPNLITRWKSEFLESGAKAVFARGKKADEADQLKAETLPFCVPVCWFQHCNEPTQTKAQKRTGF